MCKTRMYLKQEGCLSSPTERASVSAISLRHNLATSGESRRHVGAFIRFACGGIWLPQESLRHILASRWYAPGTIVVNVTWMERGFNACQTHRSMHPSIFNRFPVIQPVNSKVSHFGTFLHIMASNGTIAANVTWMERGFNAGQMHRIRSMCPSIFIYSACVLLTQPHWLFYLMITVRLVIEPSQ